MLVFDRGARCRKSSRTDCARQSVSMRSFIISGEDQSDIIRCNLFLFSSARSSPKRGNTVHKWIGPVPHWGASCPMRVYHLWCSFVNLGSPIRDPSASDQRYRPDSKQTSSENPGTAPRAHRDDVDFELCTFSICDEGLLYDGPGPGCEESCNGSGAYFISRGGVQHPPRSFHRCVPRVLPMDRFVTSPADLIVARPGLENR